MYGVLKQKGFEEFFLKAFIFRGVGRDPTLLHCVTECGREPRHKDLLKIKKRLPTFETASFFCGVGRDPRLLRCAPQSGREPRHKDLPKIKKRLPTFETASLFVVWGGIPPSCTVLRSAAGNRDTRIFVHNKRG